VELLAHLGLDVGYRFFGDLGLHHGARDPAEYGLGLALGGLPVTLEELVRAYTALAGDGRVLPLRLLPGAGGERRMLREATARLITLFLADPEARLPSFPRMGWSEYPFPVAVKTGTSSRYRDAWTVAWSQRYLVGVWLGHPDQRPMRGVSGYRAASRLVHELLVHLHPDQLQGLEDVGFPPPRGYRPVRLCALTGLLATPACDRVTLEWFPAGSEPMARCRAHRLLAVDRRDGLLATSATPRGELSVRSFVDLGPRYAAWAQATGLPTPPSRTSTLGPDGISPRPAPPRRRRPVAGSPARITISSPPNGAHLLLDPETPGGLATVALEAVVEPAVEQAVWYVDGTPFQVVDQPYGTRWSMTPGDHTFQLRLPFRPERSAVVRVRVE
jgi:penicillin-binding protein 1C